MSDIYIEYSFNIKPIEPAREILIAELGSVGFESFMENKNGVIAYIQKKDWYSNILENIFILSNNNFLITFQKKEIKQQNWNEKWEKNFTPIKIKNKVHIRAPFHEKSKLDYDIIIEPKMSFGTGHHETTYMMIEYLLQLNLKGKKILDMGCGTGVLAIFAEKKNASQIDAIDIDSWSYNNTIKNIKTNQCKKINVYKGDVRLLIGKNYDIIIANINRNILLKDIKKYSICLNKNGILLLSGFYKQDILIIKKETLKYNLKFVSYTERNKWVAVKFIK